MASHASAIKAHRQSVKRQAANRDQRARLRNRLKAVRVAIQARDEEKARAELRATISLIDKMAGRGIIHRNAAARYKSRLHASIRGLAAA